MSFSLATVQLTEEKSSTLDILKELKNGNNITIISRFINNTIFFCIGKFNSNFIDNNQLATGYFQDYSSQIASLYEEDKLTVNGLHSIIATAYMSYIVDTNRYMKYLQNEDPIASICNDAKEITSIFLHYTQILDT